MLKCHKEKRWTSELPKPKLQFVSHLKARKELTILEKIALNITTIFQSVLEIKEQIKEKFGYKKPKKLRNSFCQRVYKRQEKKY